MQFVSYWLIYPFLLLLSRLPLWFLYLISKGIYGIVFYIIGYRKQVVLNNLKIAFPNKPETELKEIRKKFYKHLSEITVETVKTISISEKELQKRFVITNPEIIPEIEAYNKSVLLMFGHYASWEWSTALQNQINLKGYAVYKPLKNRYFNELIKRIRSRFNTTLISTKEAVLTIKRNDVKGVRSIIGILSDQSPKLQDATYYTSFFGQNVPTFTGPEILAKRLDLAVVFLKIKKIRTGHYEATLKVLAKNAKELPDYSLTNQFIKEVEQQIKEEPAYYFWTHKRWKYKQD